MSFPTEPRADAGGLFCLAFCLSVVEPKFCRPCPLPGYTEAPSGADETQLTPQPSLAAGHFSGTKGADAALRSGPCPRARTHRRPGNAGLRCWLRRPGGHGQAPPGNARELLNPEDRDPARSGPPPSPHRRPRSSAPPPLPGSAALGPRPPASAWASSDSRPGDLPARPLPDAQRRAKAKKDAERGAVPCRDSRLWKPSPNPVQPPPPPSPSRGRQGAQRAAREPWPGDKESR